MSVCNFLFDSTFKKTVKLTTNRIQEFEKGKSLEAHKLKFEF